MDDGRAASTCRKYDDDTLGHSSLILADEMYRVPSKEIGAGSFVIGNTHVRPRVSVGGPAMPPKFSRAQNLNFWMQVYNLGIDDKSKQNDATVEYADYESGDATSRCWRRRSRRRS